MTVAAPAKAGTIRSVVRMPDRIISMIDERNNDLFTTRADFVLTAIGEFAYEMIVVLNQTIEKYGDAGYIEEQTAKVELDVADRIGKLLAAMSPMPEDPEEFSTVMVHLPEGLESQMQYVIDLVPCLKNTTVFARAATYFRVCRVGNEVDSVKAIEKFVSKRDSLDKGSYLKEIRKKYNTLIYNGEEIVDSTIFDKRYKNNKDFQFPKISEIDIPRVN